jgi:hypothetical protein
MEFAIEDAVSNRGVERVSGAVRRRRLDHGESRLIPIRLKRTHRRRRQGVFNLPPGHHRRLPPGVLVSV